MVVVDQAYAAWYHRRTDEERQERESLGHWVFSEKDEWSRKALRI